MQCYNHPNTEAVAVCKHCHKGLCRNCSIEMSDGVVCSASCEEKVKVMNLLIQQAERSQQDLRL